MTQYPEAVLARELGLCYAGVALVTDFDAGVEREEAVTMDEVFRVLGENVDRVKALLHRAIPAIPAEPGCACAAGAMDPGSLPA